LHNLATNPKYGDQRLRLEKLLSQARQQFEDPIDFTVGNTSSALAE